MDAKQSKDCWMTTLQPWLRDRCLGDVILPGTHNSGSFSITTQNAVIVDKMVPLQLAFQLGLKVKKCLPLTEKKKKTKKKEKKTKNKKKKSPSHIYRLKHNKRQLLYAVSSILILILIV